MFPSNLENEVNCIESYEMSLSLYLINNNHEIIKHRNITR